MVKYIMPRPQVLILGITLINYLVDEYPERVFLRSLKSSHLQSEAQQHSDLCILIICPIHRLILFRNYLTEMGLGPCIGRIFRKENLSFHVVNVIFCYTSNVMKLFLSFPGEREN